MTYSLRASFSRGPYMRLSQKQGNRPKHLLRAVSVKLAMTAMLTHRTCLAEVRCITHS